MGWEYPLYTITFAVWILLKFQTLLKLKTPNCLSSYLRLIFILCSFILHLLVLLAPSFVWTLPKFQILAMLKFINNSLFMSILALTYLLLRFVHCSSFVRLLFVHCSSFFYLPVRLALCLVACRTTTSYHHQFSIIGIIGIFDIITFSFFAFHYFTENPFPSVLSYPFTFFRSE